MAHVAAVALAAAATTPSGAMPTVVPLEWKGRLQLGSDVATTAQVIDDLVAGKTGVPRSTGSFTTAEAVRAAKEVTFAPSGDPAVLDRQAAAKGLRAVIMAMAIPVPAAQERGRAREVFTVLVAQLVEARDAGCSLQWARGRARGGRVWHGG